MAAASACRSGDISRNRCRSWRRAGTAARTIRSGSARPWRGDDRARRNRRRWPRDGGHLAYCLDEARLVLVAELLELLEQRVYGVARLVVGRRVELVLIHPEAGQDRDGAAAETLSKGGHQSFFLACHWCSPVGVVVPIVGNDRGWVGLVGVEQRRVEAHSRHCFGGRSETLLPGGEQLAHYAASRLRRVATAGWKAPWGG